MIRVSIITVSDSTAAGQREDRSGPAIREFVEQQGWSVASSAVVADERMIIAQRLTELSAEGAADVILTTGGTGVADRDVTPEATRAVVEREIPGLGELMRAEGRKSTPYAVLSRGLVGAKGRTLIVNLPGSPKGALESIQVIADLIPHIVDLLQGRTEHAAPAKRTPQ
ncbi:MAG: MogA/MoaB family molybdenum cofactor biosynthesis protein [Bryobacteraceae bacterium]